MASSTTYLGNESTYLTSFPDYQSNQLLTSANLNNSFDYLEQQERVTRILSSRKGIISGLDYTVTMDSSNTYITAITIDPGFGISIDGYVIAPNLNGDLAQGYTGSTGNPFTFSGYMQYPFSEADYAALAGANPVTADPAYNGPASNANWQFTAYELVQDGNASSYTGNMNSPGYGNAFTPFGANNPFGANAPGLSNYVVALYLEITEVENQNCNSNSCDSSGNTVSMRVVPLLVPKFTDVPLNNYLIERVPLFNELTPATQNIISTIHLARLSGLLSVASLNDLFTATYSNILANFATINTAITEITTNLVGSGTAGGPNGLLATYPDLQTNVMAMPTLQNMQTLITGVTQIQTLFGNPQGLTVYEFPLLQYYCEFATDLELAINEFITRYNKISASITIETGQWVKRFIVLGQVQMVTTGPDPYRYNATNSDDQQQDWENQLSVLVNMYNRIIVMISKFLPTAAPTVPAAPSGIIYRVEGNEEQEELAKQVTLFALIGASMDSAAMGLRQTVGEQEIETQGYKFLQLQPTLLQVVQDAYPQSAETITITPTRRTPSPLGSRAIPYYYDMYNVVPSTDPLFQLWKAGMEDEVNINDIYNYYDFTDNSGAGRVLNVDGGAMLSEGGVSNYNSLSLDEYPAYLVEGLLESPGNLNNDAETVANTLYSLIVNNNLAISLLIMMTSTNTDILSDYPLSFISGSNPGPVRSGGTIILIVQADEEPTGVYDNDVDGIADKPTYIDRVIGHYVLDYFIPGTLPPNIMQWPLKLYYREASETTNVSVANELAVTANTFIDKTDTFIDPSLQKNVTVDNTTNDGAAIDDTNANLTQEIANDNLQLSNSAAAKETLATEGATAGTTATTGTGATAGAGATTGSATKTTLGKTAGTTTKTKKTTTAGITTPASASKTTAAKAVAKSTKPATSATGKGTATTTKPAAATTSTTGKSAAAAAKPSTPATPAKTAATGKSAVTKPATSSTTTPPTHTGTKSTHAAKPDTTGKTKGTNKS